MNDQQEAIPFITFREPEGFVLTDEARAFLSELDSKPLGVISIVGKYRTGKSYFVNKVLLDSGEEGGFAVGPTINPCTKGLWLWKKTINVKNDNHGEDFNVLIMDTEGFGGIDENVNHDTRIFLFSLLLSSYFIFNSVGNIDENALQSLSLIINLAKDVKIKNEGDPTDDELAEAFPSFLWVIRDFVLGMEDQNGAKISSKQYLENSLAIQKGVSESIQGKNRIRKNLKHFFQNRDCMTFVRPVEHEKDLQKLNTLSETQVRPEFVKQIRKAKDKIFKEVRPKLIGGKIINGSMLLETAEAYVKAVNTGRVPNVENAWTYVCHQETEKAVKGSLALVDEVISQEKKEDPGFLNTATWKDRVRKKVMKAFKKRALGGEKDVMTAGEKLQELVDQKLEKIETDNRYVLEKELGKEFEDGFFGIKAQVMKGEIKEIGEVHEKLKELEAKILKGDENQAKKNILASLSNAKEKEMLEALLELKRVEERRIAEAQESMGKQLDDLRQKLTEAETGKEELEAELNKASAELKTLKGEKQHMQEKIDRLSEQLSQEQQRYSALDKEFLSFKHNAEKEKLEAASRLQTEQDKKAQELDKRHRELETQLMLKQQECDLLRKEVERKDRNEQSLNKEIKEHKAEIAELTKQMNTMAVETPEAAQKKQEVAKRLNELENQVFELKMNKQYLADQVEFYKGQNEDTKRLYEKLLFNNNPASQKTGNDNTHGELVSVNKTLSVSLSKMQSKNKMLEEQVEYYKQFKKIVKYANSVQCHKCFRNVNPQGFLEHLQNCSTEDSSPSKYKPLVASKEEPQPSLVRLPEKPKKQSPGLSVQIRRTEISKTKDKPFIVYLVEVNREGKYWTVKKRYMEFCNLYNDVLSELPGVVVPKSSSVVQTLYNNISSGQRKPMVEDRKQMLEKFINDLVMNSSIRYSSTLREFLQLDEPMPEGHVKDKYGNDSEDNDVERIIDNMESDDMHDKSADNHNSIIERNNPMNQSSRSEIPISDRDGSSHGFNKTDKELYFKPSYRKRLY